MCRTGRSEKLCESRAFAPDAGQMCPCEPASPMTASAALALRRCLDIRAGDIFYRTRTFSADQNRYVIFSRLLALSTIPPGASPHWSSAQPMDRRFFLIRRAIRVWRLGFAALLVILLLRRMVLIDRVLPCRPLHFDGDVQVWLVNVVIVAVCLEARSQDLNAQRAVGDPVIPGLS